MESLEKLDFPLKKKMGRYSGTRLINFVGNYGSERF